MKTIKISTYIALILTAVNVSAALGQATQTIRGMVVDEVSKTPLIGVSIAVLETNLGSVTDEEGNYRLGNVPVGRQTIQVSYIGYEPQQLANIVVTAGKERQREDLYYPA